MLRVTDDILELRRWVEERGGHPCRRADGRLGLCFGDRLEVTMVDWGEFESVFCLGKSVLVYDDAPGCHRAFIGSKEEARDFVASIDPRLHGAAEGTP